MAAGSGLVGEIDFTRRTIDRICVGGGFPGAEIEGHVLTSQLSIDRPPLGAS